MVPANGFRIVLRNTTALEVNSAKVEPRICIPLVRSQTEPPHTFRSVLRQAQTYKVHIPEIELPQTAAFIRCRTKPAEGLLVLLADTLAVLTEDANPTLRGCIPLIR